MKRIVVLGSTGSIGTQTVDVVRQHSDELEIVGLAVNTRVGDMLAQARAHNVRNLAVGDERLADQAIASEVREQAGAQGVWGFGMDAVVDLVRLPEADVVVNALVGAAGLRASYETLRAGKVLALANKESLVVGGDLIMPLAAQVDAQRRAAGTAPAVGPAGALMPIDSEHGAIYQCLLGESEREVSRLWVTASGGPFRGRSREELRNVTRAQALDHPNWKMGAKISIDSATMMNKALEVVEAFHLYGVPLEKITVLVHPQSLVHSLVQFTDGSQLAQLGTPDMRIPIAACLFWPRCVDTGVPPLDLVKAGTLQFFAPDDEAFPALKLARRALRERGGMSVVMNAANEAAVELFLSGKCAFADIADLVSAAMDAHAAGEPGHEPFCPPLSCSGDDSLALEREVTILTERMSRLDLKTRELVKQLARAGVDEC